MRLRIEDTKFFGSSERLRLNCERFAIVYHVERGSGQIPSLSCRCGQQ
jgi:hypothetical protein